jgi:hypothetical protein
MIRRHLRFRRVALSFAFAAVLAALVAPSAVAKPTSTGSLQPVASEMSVQSTITPLQADGLRWQAMADFYNQRAAAQQSVASEMSVQPDNGPGITAAGTAIANQQHKAYPVPVTVAASSTSDGFDYTDAGIGASAAFAALLLLGTMLVVSRRHRSGGGFASA